MIFDSYIVPLGITINQLGYIHIYFCSKLFFSYLCVQCN